MIDDLVEGREPGRQGGRIHDKRKRVNEGNGGGIQDN